ncbi:DUF1674 domain-containing protein [Luteimonas sp. e5]
MMKDTMIGHAARSADQSPADTHMPCERVEGEPVPTTPALPPEVGGREGPEPTRYGDWEKNGRCIDF